MPIHCCTRLRRLVLVFALLLAVSAPLRQMAAWAQGESGRAGMSGRVTDATGGVIPKATVTITDTGTQQTRTVQTDAAGLYNFPGLLVSTYSLKVSAPGFGDTRIDAVPLTVGQTSEINLVMAPAGATNTVTVTADLTDLTGREQTDNASVIGNVAVENLPTRGRNFTDFALLTPGISQELDRYGLVINGQRSGNSNISIDGVDFNDPLQNGQRGGSVAAYFFPQVAVREFQIVRTGLSVEVGRTNAGFVNVVTKSGTNRIHGEAVYSNRNPWLTWPDALNDPEATNNQNQIAFGIGGPILRDKLFYYAGVEKTYFEVPFFVRVGSNCPIAGYYDPNNYPQDYACTLADGAGPTVLPAQYAALETNSYGLNSPLASAARLDWQVNPRNTAMLQYMSTFLNNVAYGISGISQAAVSNNTTYAQQSQAVVLGLTTVVNSTQTNEAHVQWVYDNRQQRPNTPGAEIDIGDFLNIGGNTAGTYIYRAIREEAVDNYSWLLGKHSLRFGFDVNLEPETQQREYYPNGLWTVDTFEDYLAALPVAQGGGGQSPQAINASASSGCGAEASTCPFQFQQTLPYNNGALPRYIATQREFAGYIQDNFRAAPRLTLTLGFRYEAQLEPKAPVNPAVAGTGVDPSDVTMWQPRFGLAWDVHGNGATVFRASTGLFDARTPGYILQHDFTDNGQFVANIDSNYDQNILSDINFGSSFGSYSAVPAADQAYTLNDIYTNNSAFRNPRSYQAAASIEQLLTKRLALVISGTHQETWKLQHRLDTNLFPPTVDAATLYPRFPTVNPLTNVTCTYGPGKGVAVPCRPNSTIAGFHQNFSTAHSTYDSLIVQMKGYFTRRLQGGMNFTWASIRDDDSNERDADRELAMDSLCVSCYNRGYSQQDIRDQFNMYLVYHAPKRFIFTTSFITRTPLPYTAVTSGSKQGDLNNDGNTKNDRPILCSQIPYTTCQVSATQFNAYKGGAEEGTVVGRNTFRQVSYEYQGNLPTTPQVAEGNDIDGVLPPVSSIPGIGYRKNNGFLDTYIAGHRVFNLDFLNWGFLNLDMRLIKEFRIKGSQNFQLSAECLNCSRAANLNLGGNATSKFTHAQSTLNTATGYYYSSASAGQLTTAPDTFRSGGPRQIQLGARYIF